MSFCSGGNSKKSGKHVNQAIMTSPFANEVDISDSVFEGFHRGIVIQKHRSDYNERESEKFAPFKLTKNNFAEISEYAVVEITNPNEAPFIKGTDRCVLNGNLCAPN